MLVATVLLLPPDNEIVRNSVTVLVWSPDETATEVAAWFCSADDLGTVKVVEGKVIVSYLSTVMVESRDELSKRLYGTACATEAHNMATTVVLSFMIASV